MSSSPVWKVYDDKGKYQAACKQPEAAAAVVSIYSDGASIRWNHRKADTAWTEGVDGYAGESYDAVADACIRKLDEIRKAYLDYQR